MITKRSDIYISNQNICSTYIHNLVKLHTCDQFWSKFLFISEIQNGGWGRQETFCWWITSGGFARWFAGKISLIDYGITSHSFQEYFGKFGELDSVKLKMDPMTGNLPVTNRNKFLIRSIPGICLHFIQDWGGTWQVNRSKFLFSYLSLQWLVRKYVLWQNVLLYDYYIHMRRMG